LPKQSVQERRRRLGKREGVDMRARLVSGKGRESEGRLRAASRAGPRKRKERRGRKGARAGSAKWASRPKRRERGGKRIPFLFIFKSFEIIVKLNF
jgi:hypothetical protein